MDRLRAALACLSEQQYRAAVFALENPERFGPRSVREVAQEAGVSPSTYVRLSRSLGFTGFKAFKASLLAHGFQPTQNARDLQARSAEGRLSDLQREMLAAAEANVAVLARQDQTAALQTAAHAITSARKVFVLGVGIASAVAQNFAYLGAMALDSVTAVTRDGADPIDALAWAGPDDVLIAMTFKPYRREVVTAVEVAHAQGVTVIALSDSPAAPHFAQAAHCFEVPVTTPQFFTSTVALTAFLETLMAFVIAGAPAQAVEHIRRFHERRHRLGLYLEEP